MKIVENPNELSLHFQSTKQSSIHLPSAPSQQPRPSYSKPHFVDLKKYPKVEHKSREFVIEDPVSGHKEIMRNKIHNPHNKCRSVDIYNRQMEDYFKG